MASQEHDVHVVPIGVEEIGALVGPAAALMRQLVSDGAALGWVDPPPDEEVAALLQDVAEGSRGGDSCIVAASQGPELVGIGYWRRYTRPTHHPHADVEKVAVKAGRQGRGIGRALMTALVATAAESGVEVLTLDLRGDNDRAASLYRSLGFRQYGRLERFVAVGAARYDTLFYSLDLRVMICES